jgi:hypothetical protein
MAKERKNAVIDRDIQSPIKGQMYPDKKNTESPKKRGNKPFFQVYKGASFEFLKEKMNKNPKAMSVWWELVGLMDNQGAVMISQPALAKFFGKSRQTISTWISWLDDEDLISIFKIGTANVYAINAELVSDQLVTKKQQFSMFNARVIAEKSEQTNKIKNKFFSVADNYVDPRQQNLLKAIDEAEKSEK